MATTPGTDIRTVGDIVYVLTKCSKSDADAAEKEICKKPEAVATLLAACGLATYSIGAGGKLVVAGLGTAGSTVIPGILFAGAGYFAARKFCSAAVNGVTQSIR